MDIVRGYLQAYDWGQVDGLARWTAPPAVRRPNCGSEPTPTGLRLPVMADRWTSRHRS